MNTPGNKSSRVRKRKAKTIRKKLNYKLLENDDMCENLISKFSNSWDNIQINNLENNGINDLIIKNIETAASKTLPETVEQKLHQPWQNDEKLRELYSKKDGLFKKNANPKDV